jgi:cytosine/adenosine deaminase-related metal-dependent hydrolase
LQKLVAMARENRLPMAMHLAESREELQLLRDGTGPFKMLLEERSMWDEGAIPLKSRPIDYLRMLADAPRALIIHGNYLDQEELEFIGAHRGEMSLVFCPRTHAYFFHSAYPLGQALAAGVRVALGTDSRASNPDLSLLSEMRHVARMHPHVPAEEVLRMGTLNGADALGSSYRREGAIGRGRRANLVAIPITSKLFATPDEILTEILQSESLPSAVYLAGRPLNA